MRSSKITEEHQKSQKSGKHGREPFMIVAHIIVMVMPFLVVGELINEYGI